MLDVKQFRSKLEQSVRDALVDPTVRAIEVTPVKFFGVVHSETFEGLNEAERQAIVWHAVFENFDEDEQRQIEFIYTDAPSEVDEPAPAPAG